jgi:hypothetical protein
MRPHALKALLASTMAAIVGVLLSNCTSRCSPQTDTLECDGNKVRVCACTDPIGTDLAGGPLCDSDGYSWTDGKVCAVACDTAINPVDACVASKHPVLECAQDGYACWNGDITYCANGYPLPTQPCAAGKQCTPVDGCQALCLASSATTDPRCPASAGLANGVCDNNAAYFCACGYLLDSKECGAPPNDCIASPFYDSFNARWGTMASCGVAALP